MKTLILLLLFSSNLFSQPILTKGYYFIVKDGVIIKDSCYAENWIIINSNVEYVGGKVYMAATINEMNMKKDLIKGIVSDSAYTMKYNYKSRKFEIGTLYINYDTKEAYLGVREWREDGVYKCTLEATNQKIINAVGDFDFIHDQNENKKFTNKDIAKLIIKTRVDDGTIDEKFKKENSSIKAVSTAVPIKK
jgi:hypothetical protein